MAVDTYKDNAHGAWIGFQTTAGTFATPATPMAWLAAPPRMRFNRPQAKPDIQRLTRWDHIEEFDTTEDCTLDLDFIVDSHDFGFLLTGALGNDGYTGGTHLWLPGALTGTGAVQPLLSMMVTSGGQDAGAATWQVRKFRDCRVTSLPAPVFDPTTGVLMGRATIVCIYDGVTTAAQPTYLASGKAGLPFANGRVTFQRSGGVIYPIITGSINFTNDARALYGSPSAAAAGPLKPYRFTEGAQGGTADIVYDSSVGLNASFDDFESGTTAAWAITATTSGSDALTITIPRIKFDTGEIDPTNDDTRQHVSGDWLYHTATGSGVTVSLVGPKTAAYNS